MEARLVAQALNYHGQQLQKVWESERNENELAMLNLKEPSFEIYQQRQKTLRYLLALGFVSNKFLNFHDVRLVQMVSRVLYSQG